MKSHLIAVTFLGSIALSTQAAPSHPKTYQYDVEKLRSAMERSLKDASSAKFLSLRTALKKSNPLTYALCGEVNSKNSYGAYEGYTTFYAIIFPPDERDKEIYAVIGYGAAARTMCKEAGI